MFPILLIQESILILFALTYSRNKVNNKFLTIFSIFFVFFVGITRKIELLPDFESYSIYFKNYNTVFVEPSFKLISFLIKLSFGNEIRYLYLFYFIISYSIKIFVIINISNKKRLSLLIYASYILLIQDYIQIRAGLCSSILLLSYYLLVNKKYFFYFIACFCAAFVHYSGLISFFFIFIYFDKIKIKYWLLLIFFGFLLASLNIGITKIIQIVIPFESINRKIETYTQLQKINQSSINIFNYQNILRLSIVGLFIYKKNTVIKTDKFMFLFKTFILSVFVFTFFSDVQIIAARISQLLKVFDILFLPYLLSLFKYKSIAYIIIVLLLLLHFFSMFANSYLPF